SASWLAVRTSCRTNGLLPSERPGNDGSNPGLGFLSVKNCLLTPGPPLWHVVHCVDGSLKIFRPRSVAAVFGLGFFTNSLSEYTKSAMWVSRMPEFIPVLGPRMFRFGGPRSSLTSAGSLDVSGLRWISAPWQVGAYSTASQSPAPSRLR